MKETTKFWGQTEFRCIFFLRLLYPTATIGVATNKNLFSRFGIQKSEICRAGHAPSKTQGRALPCLSPLLIGPDVLGLWQGNSSLRLTSHEHLFCVTLSNLPLRSLVRTLVTGFRVQDRLSLRS